MAREGIGRLLRIGRYSTVVRLPSDVVSDGVFRLKVGDTVRVMLLEDGRLVVEADVEGVHGGKD
jgi:hypothetical protein